MGKAQCPGSFRKKISSGAAIVGAESGLGASESVISSVSPPARTPRPQRVFCLATEIQMRNGKPVGSLDTLPGSVINVRQFDVSSPGIRRQFDGAH